MLFVTEWIVDESWGDYANRDDCEQAGKVGGKIEFGHDLAPFYLVKRARTLV